MASAGRAGSGHFAKVTPSWSPSCPDWADRPASSPSSPATSPRGGSPSESATRASLPGLHRHACVPSHHRRRRDGAGLAHRADRLGIGGPHGPGAGKGGRTRESAHGPSAEPRTSTTRTNGRWGDRPHQWSEPADLHRYLRIHRDAEQAATASGVHSTPINGTDEHTPIHFRALDAEGGPPAAR